MDGLFVTIGVTRFRYIIIIIITIPLTQFTQEVYITEISKRERERERKNRFLFRLIRKNKKRERFLFFI